MRWSDDAFTALFNDLYPGLCRYLERLMGASGAAQEAAQEALLRLHRLGPGRVAEREERFWVYRVATRIALTELRRARLRTRLSGLLAPLLRLRLQETQEGMDPAERVERAERGRTLRQALERLPAAQRAVLLLREDDELSYAEIAALLGVSLAKIKTDLFRARRTLRAELLGSGAEPAQRSTSART